MKTSGRSWSRYQWAGLDACPESDEATPWTLTQWAGDAAGGRTPKPPALTVDTSGGFSGFGVPDSGGMRWVLGYRRPARHEGGLPAANRATAERVA